jgi:hypothetical protein
VRRLHVGNSYGTRTCLLAVRTWYAAVRGRVQRAAAPPPGLTRSAGPPAAGAPRPTAGAACVARPAPHSPAAPASDLLYTGQGRRRPVSSTPTGPRDGAAVHISCEKTQLLSPQRRPAARGCDPSAGEQRSDRAPLPLIHRLGGIAGFHQQCSSISVEPTARPVPRSITHT